MLNGEVGSTMEVKQELQKTTQHPTYNLQSLQKDKKSKSLNKIDTKNSDFRTAAKLISKLMGYEIFKNFSKNIIYNKITFIIKTKLNEKNIFTSI